MFLSKPLYVQSYIPIQKIAKFEDKIEESLW